MLRWRIRPSEVSERGGGETRMSMAGADDEGCGFARREGLRSDEDPIIGRAILRKIDDGRRARRAGRDRDRQLACGGFASADFRSPSLRIVDIVDNGEIGRFRVLRDLYPHGRGCRVVGETDVKVGVPWRGSDLDRRIADGDASVR